ncbi:MAG: hypothetical protein M9962_08690 [Oligoflexia bacterium]|nr:hypothetical protein [Oligoflexia bacterium]
MYKILFLTTLLFTNSYSAQAKESTTEAILKISFYSAEQVKNEYVLESCATHPNIYKSDCKRTLKFNGKTLTLPEKILTRMEDHMRGFNSEDITEGLVATKAGAICQIGGPSSHKKIETLYYKTKDKPTNLTAIMVSGSCNFIGDSITPTSCKSKTAIASLLSLLETVESLGFTK